MRWIVIAIVVCLAHQLLSQSFSTGLGLTGELVSNPTSLAFGPDQRLYVLDLNGSIHIYWVSRPANLTYVVDSSEILYHVRDIQNHNDNGTVHATTGRLATGLCVAGTPEFPVIYVSSSDYRVADFTDLNLDTNSGTISRLTWNGSSWDHVILVRGLPRSEENHATNGMVYDEAQNMLYVAQGGNTNAGAPFYSLIYLCEYAYSNAILTVDLDAMEAMPVLIDTSSGVSYIYDLPTVDDPTRANANGVNNPLLPGYDGVDLHDPFGGNDGLNQAKLTVGSPVQVYSGGYRNIYDVVMTDAGRLYTWDNGPNPGWGGPPVDEGIGTATNEFDVFNDGDEVIDADGLHLVSGQGYYGGHPNPIRANPDSAGLYTSIGMGGQYRTVYDSNNTSISLPWDWPPVDSALANPEEGVYLSAGIEDSSLYVSFQSTNGIAEYKGSNFNGAMQGDLLAVGLQTGEIYRVRLNAEGGVDSPDSVTILANHPGNPLDITTLGDGTLFPGTIWVALFNESGANIKSIVVFEPVDFIECTGDYDYEIDEDGDGYSNADEIDNNTSPCNAAHTPPDFDGTFIDSFKVSNLNDPDDDDDGINDTLDLFVWDSLNGSFNIPREFALFQVDPGTGFLSLGFTGLMMNGEDDYLDLFLTEQESGNEIIPGGAGGILTFVDVDSGDARGSLNTQRNAFHFGIVVDSTYDPFVAEVTLFGPVFSDTIEDFQSAGAYIGTGDQDNYVKLAINANDSMPGIELVIESEGTADSIQFEAPYVDTAISPAVLFIINPLNGFVQPQYRVDDGPAIDLGDGFFLEGPLLDSLRGSAALAVGVIATSRGSTSGFNASWDHISIRYAPIETRGNWILTDAGGACTIPDCCQGRHEASFVESGDKWLLMGGRENNSNVNIYDPITDSWSLGAVPPGQSMHHYQAVDYHGLVLVAGAMRGDIFEEAIDSIYVYDPIDNKWYRGPAIPTGRVRSASGVVISEDTLYMMGGMTGSHFTFLGTKAWADKFDIRTGTWTQLPDAPHRRDHFHSAFVDNKIYAVAGRRTSEGSDPSGIFEDTEEDVDVFDVTSQSWTTLVNPLPTTRAGAATAVLDHEVIVIGGEDWGQPLNFSLNETEALSTETGEWRTLDSMNVGRNGIQAIVNNGGIYIASGAGKLGGNQIVNSTEAFYLYGETEPILSPISQSSLSTSDTIDLGMAICDDSTFAYAILSNVGGTQAILVQSLSLNQGDAFSIDSSGPLPRLVKPGDSLMVRVRFVPAVNGQKLDTLIIAHSGANAPQSQVIMRCLGVTNWTGTNVAYVDSSMTADGNGASWANAFRSLSDALQAAICFSDIREIWMAKGTYRPGEERGSSFSFTDTLAIYGGFIGGETLLSERNPALNPVILSGDIGVENDSSDNVYHVIQLTSQADSIVLDGITISGGQADGPMAADQAGAGIYNDGGRVALNDVLIHSCNSVLAGSAIFSTGASAIVRLQDVLFEQNSVPVIMNSSGSSTFWIGTVDIR